MDARRLGYREAVRRERCLSLKPISAILGAFLSELAESKTDRFAMLGIIWLICFLGKVVKRSAIPAGLIPIGKGRFLYDIQK
jgi:hypothetical protein